MQSPRDAGIVRKHVAGNHGVNVDVTYVPLPEHLNRISGWLVIVLVLGVPSLMVLSALLTVGSAVSWRGSLVMGTVIAAIFGIIFAVQIGTARKRREARKQDWVAELSRSDKETSSTQLLSRLFNLDGEQPAIVWSRLPPWTWSELCDGLGPLDSIVPRCFAETFRRRGLEQIKLPDHMLEPETIAPGAAMSKAAMGFTLGTMGLGWLMVVMSSPWRIGAIWFPILAAIMLTGLPAVRRRLPWVTDRARLPVAGVGFISDHKGRTWTVNDALMFVTARSSTSPFCVYIVGKAGWLLFTFADETDPEFIKLWQRWNHPHPRPELLD